MGRRCSLGYSRDRLTSIGIVNSSASTGDMFRIFSRSSHRRKATLSQEPFDKNEEEEFRRKASIAQEKEDQRITQHSDTMRRLGEMRQYSYMELMSGQVPKGELSLEHLEWHLTEEDVLERLSICREFLMYLHPGDLYDRKYKAGLTKQQYHCLSGS